jgi:hypothetical protein
MLPSALQIACVTLITLILPKYMGTYILKALPLGGSGVSMFSGDLGNALLTANPCDGYLYALQVVKDSRILHAIRLHDMIEHGFKKKVGINTYNALLPVMIRCVCGKV